MADRDVERIYEKDAFVAVLRRLADSLEKEEPFRIQVLGKRFTVPKDAELSVEHEVEDGEVELEFQLRWKE